MQYLSDPAAWGAFLTLTLLELVLGIDNIVFISVLVDRLPKDRRETARRIGIGAAMISRILLLLVIAWIIGLTKPLFEVFDNQISWRDLILVFGGLFLIWKSTKEIHAQLEVSQEDRRPEPAATFRAVLIQVLIVDLVFSLDSIITAVGMVEEVPIMIAAIVVSVVMMMFYAGPLGRFVSAHPTVKMLALAFLFVIGVLLIADGFDHHIPKGYIYFAMAFSISVEALNMRVRGKK